MIRFHVVLEDSDGNMNVRLFSTYEKARKVFEKIAEENDLETNTGDMVFNDNYCLQLFPDVEVEE